MNFNLHTVGLHLLGEFSGAAKSFRRSLELQQNNPVCHFNLANSLNEAERLDEARRSTTSGSG